MLDKKRVLAVVGAGGHGKVVAEAAQESGDWDEVVFYDDAWPVRTAHGEWPIVGRTAELAVQPDHSRDVIVALGQQQLRLRLSAELAQSGHSLATVIHPRATLSPRARLGHGSAVLAGAVINVDAVLGLACIVNTGATVDHDCRLGDGVHVSPGAHLSGNVLVGAGTWIGAGAVVVPGIQIGMDSVVGAGAVVIRDVNDHTTVVGNPARILEKKAC